MSDSKDLGNKGEDLAVDYLRSKGFKILFRNFTWGKNEIDIVAETKDFIVFLEVKTRSEDPLDPPVNAVSREKQKAIIWAAEGYINRYGVDRESRFDVITIIRKGDDFEIDHIEDAFYPSLR
jgi:putative endonuclease